MNLETPSDASNPFRSPVNVANDRVPNRDERLPVELDRFHRKMRVAGICWIAFGAVALVVGLALLFVYACLPWRKDNVLEIFAILFVACSLWMGLGVCTCLKQVWAVYADLAMGYMFVAGLLIVAVQIEFTIDLTIVLPIALILLIVALIQFQMHRLIRMNRRLQAAGMKPKSLSIDPLRPRR